MGRSRTPLNRSTIRWRIAVAILVAFAPAPVWLCWRQPSLATDQASINLQMAVLRDASGVHSYQFGRTGSGTIGFRESDGVLVVAVLSAGIRVRWIGDISLRTQQIAPLVQRMQVEIGLQQFRSAGRPIDPATIPAAWDHFGHWIRSTTALPRRTAHLKDGMSVPAIPYAAAAHEMRVALPGNTNPLAAPGPRLVTANAPFWPVWRWLMGQIALAVISVGAVAQAFRWLSRLSRVSRDATCWCPGCFYELQTVTAGCPECGTAIRWPETA